MLLFSRLFFIDCKEFEEIAEETGYTNRHVRTLI